MSHDTATPRRPGPAHVWLPVFRLYTVYARNNHVYCLLNASGFCVYTCFQPVHAINLPVVPLWRWRYSVSCIVRVFVTVQSTTVLNIR